MKYIFLLLLCLGMMSVNAHSGCGMHLTDEQVEAEFAFRERLKSIGVQPFSGAKKLDSLITIPVKVHIIRDSAGNNNYNLLTLYTQFCELNEIYSSTGFYFYILPDINFVVDNDFIRRGSTVPEDQRFTFFGNMMYKYYQYGALNVYYTLGTGICGMAPFPSMTDIFNGRTGLLMEASNACSGVGKKTLAHELGHHFGLLHTFQGYDNKDSRYHEYVTRAEGVRNCHTAGDGFCDTPADVLDFSCPYTGTDKDLRGDRYNPDVTLIMSYHADNCQYRFSSEEMAYMNNVIRTDTARQVYLNNQLESIGSPLATETILPVNASNVYINEKTLFTWNEIPEAEAYIFTLQTRAGNLTYQTMVKGSNSLEYTFQNKERGQTLYWSVAPVTTEIPCLLPSESKQVKVLSQSTDVKSFESAQMKVYPNPLSNGERLTIQLGDRSVIKNKMVTYRWIALSGQVVYESTSEVLQSNIEINIHQHLPSGSYLLNFLDGEQVYTTTVVIE